MQALEGRRSIRASTETVSSLRDLLHGGYRAMEAIRFSEVQKPV